MGVLAIGDAKQRRARSMGLTSHPQSGPRAFAASARLRANGASPLAPRAVLTALGLRTPARKRAFEGEPRALEGLAVHPRSTRTPEGPPFEPRRRAPTARQGGTRPRQQERCQAPVKDPKTGSEAESSGRANTLEQSSNAPEGTNPLRQSWSLAEVYQHPRDNFAS
jgi:hypothetical protein